MIRRLRCINGGYKKETARTESQCRKEKASNNHQFSDDIMYGRYQDSKASILISLRSFIAYDDN